MSKHAKAIEDLRNFQRRFASILSLADALEGVDEIDNLKAEAQARLKALQDQITRETERLSQKIAVAHQEAMKIAQDAREDAVTIKSIAEGEAKQTRDKADKYYRERGTQAAVLTAAANAHHQERTEHATELVNKAKAAAQGVRDGVKEHENNLQILRENVTSAQRELASLLETIERTKADRNQLREAISSMHKNIAGA